MLVDDPPEDLVGAPITIGADPVVDLVPRPVDLGVVEIVAGDQGLQGLEGLRRERALPGESPGGLDELEGGAKVAAG
jgi:hypothetical protein